MSDFTIPLSITGVAAVVIGFITFRRPLGDLIDRMESLAWIGLKAPFKQEPSQPDAVDGLAKSHSEQQSKDQKTIERLTASKAQADNEMTALKSRVFELEREIAPYRERFSQERMFKGFQDGPRPKE